MCTHIKRLLVGVLIVLATACAYPVNVGYAGGGYGYAPPPVYVRPYYVPRLYYGVRPVPPPPPAYWGGYYGRPYYQPHPGWGHGHGYGRRWH